MSYEINQIFTNDDDYSNKAKWCNENGCYIAEIEPLEDGTRQFQIRTLPIKTLAEVQAEKHAELKSIMQARRNAIQVEFDGDTFDANESAQENMTALLRAFDLGAPAVQIRSATEVTHTFDKDTCQQLSLVMLQAVQALYAEYWELKNRLATCETIAEVEAITWPEAGK